MTGLVPFKLVDGVVVVFLPSLPNIRQLIYQDVLYLFTYLPHLSYKKESHLTIDDFHLLYCLNFLGVHLEVLFVIKYFLERYLQFWSFTLTMLLTLKYIRVSKMVFL